MKQYCIIFILFIAYFYGMHTMYPYSANNNDFKVELKEYIDLLRPQARKALSAKEWHLGVFVNWGSYFASKGNSVDTNELKLFTTYTDFDYQEAIAEQNIDEIKALSESAYNEIKNEKDANKWHDKLYNIISRYNSKRLFQDEHMNRPDAMKKMLENKNNKEVRKCFVFGIAVTKNVEDMMIKKR